MVGFGHSTTIGDLAKRGRKLTNYQGSFHEKAANSRNIPALQKHFRKAGIDHFSRKFSLCIVFSFVLDMTVIKIDPEEGHH